jgi:uncharacterized membrane protein
MDLKDLYSVILVLILVAVLLGLGLTVLAKMSTSCAINTNLNGTCTTVENMSQGTAETAMQNSISAIADIPSTWLGIIVIVVVAVIVIGLLVRNLGGSTGQR